MESNREKIILETVERLGELSDSLKGYVEKYNDDSTTMVELRVAVVFLHDSILMATQGDVNPFIEFSNKAMELTRRVLLAGEPAKLMRDDKNGNILIPPTQPAELTSRN